MSTPSLTRTALLFFSLTLISSPGLAQSPPATKPAADLPKVRISDDGKRFVLSGTDKPFLPWGFNYLGTHGELVEEFWEKDWPRVEKDFREMKKLGANVVRIHLQLGKFLDAPDRPNEKALDRLGRLLRLAEKERLYLDLTGLACYHKKDVPAWYDKLAEKDRWDVQARFWSAVAARC